jgi:hypothetical protein
LRTFLNEFELFTIPLHHLFALCRPTPSLNVFIAVTMFASRLQYLKLNLSAS